MCELLGISFNIPVNPGISFRGFRQSGEDHPHGWGIAFFRENAAQVIKEPVRAGMSDLSGFLSDYASMRSRIFIGHVRITSAGGVNYANTHPFCREMAGTEYIFAHNGTLRGFDKLEIGRFRPVGRTDSEHAFCHLLGGLEKRQKPLVGEKDFDWLAAACARVNEYGKFNCCLADGKRLFCYHDKTGYNGLCFVRRKAPFERIRLLDEDFEVNLPLEKNPEQEGFIIGTHQLTNEVWQSFEPGELIVFKEGKIEYSTMRDV